MRRRILALAFALVLATTFAACGGDDGGDEGAGADTAAVETQPEETQAEDAAGDPAAGKEVFASAGCGNCHTLEDAGATGTRAPNLDARVPEIDEERIVDQVTNGGGGMPAFGDQLGEQQIRNVAAYLIDATG